MAQDSVQVVRAIYGFFASTGDFPRELFAPDAEFDASDVMPDVSVLRGSQPEGRPEAAFRAYASLFEEFEITLERVVATSEQHVVSTVRDGGRLKGSDARVSNRFHHAWTVHDGQVVRWSSHLTVEQALEAVGLSE